MSPRKQKSEKSPQRAPKAVRLKDLPSVPKANAVKGGYIGETEKNLRKS